MMACPATLHRLIIPDRDTQFVTRIGEAEESIITGVAAPAQTPVPGGIRAFCSVYMLRRCGR
jgi:hypothetical protein